GPRQQTDFFTETAIAVDIKNNLIRRNLFESPVSFFVTNLIPRAIWPDKPKSIVMWHYSLYRRGVDIWEKGGNALPSVVGQYYLSFGTIGVIWAGILYGSIFGLIQKNIEKVAEVKSEQILLLFTLLSFLFLSFRFLSPGLHYSPLLMWMLIRVRSNKAYNTRTMEDK
ncbi:MAG: hypothetical protein OEZ01_17800, partial [Candidatus Heimdallarchaeota archaeon]|nr:hypothetical protein [Candidatus Heimdallarchaeota archaeon]